MSEKRKKQKSLTPITAFLLLIVFSFTAHAEGWSLFPGLDKDFRTESALSLSIGTGSANEISATEYGAELSFNCVLIQPPTNTIRQHVSYINYNDGAFTMHKVELNPDYMVELSKTVSIGAGPGVGFVVLNTTQRDTMLGAFQVGASMDYTGIKHLLIGLESRYQVTTTRFYDRDNEIYSNANNWRTAVRVGYQF